MNVAGYEIPEFVLLIRKRQKFVLLFNSEQISCYQQAVLELLMIRPGKGLVAAVVEVNRYIAMLIEGAIPNHGQPNFIFVLASVFDVHHMAKVTPATEEQAKAWDIRTWKRVEK